MVKNQIQSLFYLINYLYSNLTKYDLYLLLLFHFYREATKTPNTMKNSAFGLLLFLLFIISSCKTTQVPLVPQDDGIIEFNLLAINDVYEIAALENGKVGGMSRVATLKKQLIEQNKNTLLVHAGDFLNPSLIGNMKIAGEKVKGKQMVDAMNAAKVDLVVFGNHEFDIKENELLQRLKESEFTWIGTNVKHVQDGKASPFLHNKNGQMIPCPETYIWKISDKDGTTLTVGFFGATIDTNKKDYVVYEDWTVAAKRAIAFLQPQCDILIGLTHLDAVDDLKLAKELGSDIPLFIGGHDHHNMILKSGNTIVAKADANAKSAYTHTVTFNKSTKKPVLVSGLVHLNESIASDPTVESVVDSWVKKQDANFQELGFDPNEVLAEVDVPLDGKESSIRHSQTNFGNLIAKAMSYANGNKNDCAILNAGSIRVDDELAGYVTQFDILRSVPFGGKVLEVEMKGELLKQLLENSTTRKGNGAFLQMDNISKKEENWQVKNTNLEVDKTYSVAINDFLLAGYDYPFFTKDNPSIVKVSSPDENDTADLRNDIRMAIISYLKSL